MCCPVYDVLNPFQLQDGAQWENKGREGPVGWEEEEGGTCGGGAGRTKREELSVSCNSVTIFVVSNLRLVVRVKREHDRWVITLSTEGVKE